jgi:predicted permease
MDSVVAFQIAVVLVMFGCGWLARRAQVLDAGSVAVLSRLVVDVAFPALVLVELLRTLDPAAARADSVVLFCGFGVVALGMGLGRLLARSVTGAFAIGLPNWIFLPLLIAEPLYGGAGVRVVLAFNAGAQVALWTVGVGLLGGTRSVWALARNPGLLATGLGVSLALLAPSLARLASVGAGATGWEVPVAVVFEALSLVGRITVPLSLFVTGAQLADAGGAAFDRVELARVVAGRLLIVPAALVACLWGLRALGLPLTDDRFVLIGLIAAMPVAISGSLFAQRFGGSVSLASRAVLVSTVLSLGTAPVVAWGLGRIV